MQALFDSLRPYVAARTVAEKGAYSQLSTLFGLYKDIKRANYEKETAMIAELLKKLETIPHAEAVKTLNIALFVENLSESQRQFEIAFSGRQAAGIGKSPVDRKVLRQQVEKPYQLLGSYLEVTEAIQSDAERKQLLDVVNNSRKYYADLLARRKGSKREIIRQ